MVKNVDADRRITILKRLQRCSIKLKSRFCKPLPHLHIDNAWSISNIFSMWGWALRSNRWRWFPVKGVQGIIWSCSMFTRKYGAFNDFQWIRTRTKRISKIPPRTFWTQIRKARMMLCSRTINVTKLTPHSNTTICRSQAHPGFVCEQHKLAVRFLANYSRYTFSSTMRSDTLAALLLVSLASLSCHLTVMTEIYIFFAVVEIIPKFSSSEP